MWGLGGLSLLWESHVCCNKKSKACCPGVGLHVSLEGCEDTGLIFLRYTEKKGSEGRGRFEQLGHLWILAMPTNYMSGSVMLIGWPQGSAQPACLPAAARRLHVGHAWREISPLVTMTQLRAQDSGTLQLIFKYQNLMWVRVERKR